MNRLTFFCIALSISSLASAEDYDAIVDKALGSAIELKAATLDLESQVIEAGIETNLSDPELEFEHLWGKFDTKLGFGISQSFDWPGIYKVRRSRAEAVRLRAAGELSSRYADLRTELRRAVIDIIGAKERVRILGRTHEGYLKMLEIYEQGYRDGSISILDLNKLKIELVKNEGLLNSANDDLAELTATLNTLTGDPSFSDNTEFPDRLPLMELKPIEEYRRMIEMNDASVKNAVRDHQIDCLSVEEARMETYPGFSVGYRFAREDGEIYNGFSVGVTLPFFSARGKVDAASKRQAASLMRLAAVRNAAESSLRRDYQLAQSLSRMMHSYAPAVEGTDNLALLQTALDSGQITLTSYLQDVNYFLEAHLDYHDVFRRYCLALVSLSRYQ